MKKRLIVLLVLISVAGFCEVTTMETSHKNTTQTGLATFTQPISIGTHTNDLHAVNYGWILTNTPTMTYDAGVNYGSSDAQAIRTPPAGTKMVIIIAVGQKFNLAVNTHTGRYIGIVDLTQSGRVFPLVDVNHSTGTNSGFTASWTGSQVVLSNKAGMDYVQTGNVIMLNVR